MKFKAKLHKTATYLTLAKDRKLNQKCNYYL